MSHDGRVTGLTFAVQHLLRALEAKGVLRQEETRQLLDEVLQELSATNLSDDQRATAARTIGALYLPKRDA